MVNLRNIGVKVETRLHDSLQGKRAITFYKAAVDGRILAHSEAIAPNGKKLTVASHKVYGQLEEHLRNKGGKFLKQKGWTA